MWCRPGDCLIDPCTPAKWNCLVRWEKSCGQLDLLVAELWIILTYTLFWEVGEVFIFYWHHGEGSLMKCVWASACEAHFEVNLFVLCRMYIGLFWKGRLPDWCSVIFCLCCVLLASLCSSSHPPLSVSSLSLFSDKTVKIWSSKVWRKRWQPKWFLCRSSCCYFSLWSVTCALPVLRCDTENTVSKAIKVFSFALSRCKMTKPRQNMYSKAKKNNNNLPFKFFYCQFESAIQVRCYLDKINRTFPAVDAPGWTIPLLTWKLPQPGIKRKRKSVLLFCHQGFRILVEQWVMNLLKDVCVHVSAVKTRVEFESQRDVY